MEAGGAVHTLLGLQCIAVHCAGCTVQYNAHSGGGTVHCTALGAECTAVHTVHCSALCPLLRCTAGVGVQTEVGDFWCTWQLPAGGLNSWQKSSQTAG